MPDMGLFEAIYSARSIRRLKPDPVPEDSHESVELPAPTQPMAVARRFVDDCCSEDDQLVSGLARGWLGKRR